MKTTYPDAKSIPRTWHLVDVKNQILGRVATSIARTLSGKAKRFYTPHIDCGDYVVVLNAEHIKITGGNKPVQKIDFRHSGYPGGDVMTPYSKFLKSNPDRAIELAVSGMLPKNKLRAHQMKRLRVFKGETHPYGAQFAKRAEQPA